MSTPVLKKITKRCKASSTQVSFKTIICFHYPTHRRVSPYVFLSVCKLHIWNIVPAPVCVWKMDGCVWQISSRHGLKSRLTARCVEVMKCEESKPFQTLVVSTDI